MSRRLALMSDVSHTSPWTKASGDESVAVVRSLGEGEMIWLEVELQPEGKLLLTLVEGLNPLLSFNPREWGKYRVRKEANGHRVMTTVEVYLGRN